MLFNLLEQAVAASENFGERAASGGFTFLLGMIVVFGGMILLVLCVSGFGVLVNKIAEKGEKKSEKAKGKEQPAEKPIETTDDGSVPEEIRVAIIAAIAAYYAESGSKNEFKVRKIKKL